MELLYFPPYKKKLIEEELDKEVKKVNEQTNENIRKINQNAFNAANKISQSTPKKAEGEIENKSADSFMFIGGIIGAVLGYVDSQILGLIVLAIVGGFVGFIIGSVIGRSNEKSHNINVQNIANQNKQKSQVQYSNAEKLVDAENKKNDKKKKDLQQSYNNTYQAYKKEFDDAVTQKSAQYADSALVKKVVDVLIDDMSISINSADRSEHIEKIDIKYKFFVNTNSITTSTGFVFDFEKNRCQSISSPVDMAALARSISTHMNIELLLKYSQDKSGTVPTIKMRNSYDITNTITSVNYVAPNGNYKQTQTW